DARDLAVDVDDVRGLGRAADRGPAPRYLEGRGGKPARRGEGDPRLLPALHGRQDVTVGFGALAALWLNVEDRSQRSAIVATCKKPGSRASPRSSGRGTAPATCPTPSARCSSRPWTSSS